MGEVYRARDTRLDRTVAIKVLASHLSSSPELKQRMEREARAISSLNHPHICHLYDIGSQDGIDYLNGLLVLGSGGTADWQLVWMDRNGKQIGTVADKLTNLQTARISPQGDRIALQIDTGMNDIWVLDLVRGVRTRLTFGPVSNTFPVWSPDGKWIAYTSEMRKDVWTMLIFRCRLHLWRLMVWSFS
jgi:WD40-like Beta Propeller Repeat